MQKAAKGESPGAQSVGPPHFHDFLQEPLHLLKVKVKVKSFYLGTREKRSNHSETYPAPSVLRKEEVSLKETALGEQLPWV